MLEIRQLNQFYGGSHILWDVDMSIAPGSCTCLMGRNGMGKTTLLRCIMGLLPATGELLYDGQNLTRLAADRRAGLGIGYVPQGREIFSQLTVEENLRIGLSARKHKVRDIPEQIFELFPVLKKMLRRRGGDLSGGQQQQLAIGRALVLEPRLLILDEATEGLAPLIRAEIWRCLARLKESGLAILVIDKNVGALLRVADRHFLIERGRVVWSGASAALAAAPDVQHRYLGV